MASEGDEEICETRDQENFKNYISTSTIILEHSTPKKHDNNGFTMDVVEEIQQETEVVTVHMSQMFEDMKIENEECSHSIKINSKEISLGGKNVSTDDKIHFWKTIESFIHDGPLYETIFQVTKVCMQVKGDCPILMFLELAGLFKLQLGDMSVLSSVCECIVKHYPRGDMFERKRVEFVFTKVLNFIFFNVPYNKSEIHEGTKFMDALVNKANSQLHSKEDILDLLNFVTSLKTEIVPVSEGFSVIIAHIASKFDFFINSVNEMSAIIEELKMFSKKKFDYVTHAAKMDLVTMTILYKYLANDSMSKADIDARIDALKCYQLQYNAPYTNMVVSTDKTF